MTETTEEKLKRLNSYDEELSKVFPKDCKDWWKNSKSEWPLVARLRIECLEEEVEWWSDIFNILLQENEKLKEKLEHTKHGTATNG